MTPRRSSAILFLLVLFAAVANADRKQPDKPAGSPRISKETRMNLVRAFNAELVYVRAYFPMGKRGLILHDGDLSPSGEELKMLMATYGPAAKPGDLARISNIQVKDRVIRFEINGGPVKKKKWYQRIEISGAGGSTPVAPSDPQANPRGSFVELVFDRYVPELSPQELKDLLRPVFDFNSKSPLEAYLETVSPKVKEAIKNHQVLVGMNQEMVIYAKGRPPKKLREKDGDVEYEEWIYGEPPQDVDFVRFVGNEVVRLEIMKVGGEKVVRTEREVEVKAASAAGAKSEQQPRPANAPSLRRPGEEMPAQRPASGVSPTRPAPPQAPPDPNATPN